MIHTNNIDLKHTDSAVTFMNRWDHFLARWSINRAGHVVEPGLYAIGEPNEESPVFVTANYTISFDCLRSTLDGIDGYILVLDTKGINVWCAAGKGTFGTDELVQRIEATGLKSIVHHRVLILPQLGAPGVAAHEVKQRSGFNVEYGPVRVKDLQIYLQSHRATPEMRRVHFNLCDRLVLIPVELVHILVPALIIAVVSYLLGGIDTTLVAISAILAGVVVFPILLPWLPTGDFSSKGLFLGVVIVILVILLRVFSHSNNVVSWLLIGRALSNLLIWPPVTAFITLNFTGSTTFTSRSGVRREMFKYLPKMAWSFGAGVLLIIVLTLIRILGGR